MALKGFVIQLGQTLQDTFRSGQQLQGRREGTTGNILQEQSAFQEIKFTFNPLNAPNIQEWEIRSLKQAQQVTLGNQSVTKEGLQSVLVEIESILDATAWAYIFSKVVTPIPSVTGVPDFLLPVSGVVLRENSWTTPDHQAEFLKNTEICQLWKSWGLC